MARDYLNLQRARDAPWTPHKASCSVISALQLDEAVREDRRGGDEGVHRTTGARAPVVLPAGVEVGPLGAASFHRTGGAVPMITRAVSLKLTKGLSHPRLNSRLSLSMPSLAPAWPSVRLRTFVSAGHRSPSQPVASHAPVVQFHG